MKLLLDTRVFLWFITGDARLSPASHQQLCDPANDVFLSVASLWECVVKSQLGRLPLPQPPEVYIPAQRTIHQIDSLEIDEASVLALAQLPMLHRDPFDRILMAQATAHQLSLLTADAAIVAYNLAAVVKVQP